MAKNFGNYKVVIIDDRKKTIIANHQKKEILVSKDIGLDVTKDGKLKATFIDNASKKQNYTPFVFNMYGYSIPATKEPINSGCSIQISDPATFNHCVKKDGVFQLSADNVTFDGSAGNDILVLRDCRNSKINMGSGDDAVLYRENTISDNEINLGDGNNLFSATYTTDKSMPLTNNTITSGIGNDYVYLRNSSGNTINTGSGDDIVEIQGIEQANLTYKNFTNNVINTSNGDDTVNIHGKFDNFKNNEIYLGKGSDSLYSAINQNSDATSQTEYNQKIPLYMNSVSDNKIYATEGKPGFFEKNVFNSSTYTSNQLSPYHNLNAVLEGFNEENKKSLPNSTPLYVQETKAKSAPKKLTRDDYSKRYATASFGAMLFNSPEMQNAAFKVLDDYVKSMNED